MNAPIIQGKMTHGEFARVVALLYSTDPVVMVGWDACILQSIQRESGNGRTFNVEVQAPGFQRRVVFVRLEG